MIMKLFNNFILIIAALLILSICNSCKKFVGIGPRPDMITTSAVFSNDNTAVSAVDGIYVQLRNVGSSPLNGAITIYAGLSSDEIYNTSPSNTYDPFFSNSIISTNGTISSFWTLAYKNIYTANAILEDLGKNSGVNDTVKNQLSGEMKVVRSLLYFYLVNLYGDVPLITTTDYRKNASIPRTPVSQVYGQIAGDLRDAKSLLKDSYPSAGKERPNKWTAAALLARVYLYQKDWPDAEVEATGVINAGYNLVNLDDVFKINSSETIWELESPNNSRNTTEGSNFIPSSPRIKPTFAITNYLLNAFEANDQRETHWLKTNVINGISYYYPYKYKMRTNTPVQENEVVLRLGEQYLIRAEARAQQNNLSGAQEDLNIIRNRAGLPNTTANDKNTLITAIYQERQTELFCEWGHRWFNLKRTGNVDSVLSLEKNGWHSSAALYPLPYTELQLNPLLTQNPGY